MIEPATRHLDLEQSDMGVPLRSGESSVSIMGFNLEILEKKKSGKRYWTTDEVSGILFDLAE